MSELSERQRAINTFHNFVSQHLQAKARHASSSASARDATLEVRTEDVLDIFCELHPQHAPFRLEVLESSPNQKTFAFIKRLWVATAAKPGS